MTALKNYEWESQLGFGVKPLIDGCLVRSVARLYQEVFGNDPVWGEGAYCSAEGWAVRISLDEYEQQEEAEGCPRCSCGASLKLCHPLEQVELRIREMIALEFGYGFALVKDDKPVGFIKIQKISF